MLLEVIAAIAVVALGLTAFASGIPIAAMAVSDGAELSTATFLAAARMEERMECLEEPIHTVYDHYDTVAWRADDRAHFKASMVVEWLILAVLTAELLALLAQNWR